VFGVRSRQLIEHGSTASSLVLVGVGRLLGLVTGRRQVGRHRWTTTGWTVCHRTTTGWTVSVDDDWLDGVSPDDDRLDGVGLGGASSLSSAPASSPPSSSSSWSWS